MSSDDRTTNGWPAGPWRRAAAIAVMAVALAGCIRPLYSQNTGSTLGGDVRSSLASVDVPMIEGRLGHTLRNELVFLLDGRNAGPAKRYRLVVTPSENISVALVNSDVQRADAAAVNGTAAYRLLSLADNKELAAGSVTAFATYERSPQRFANLRAAQDAQSRVARSMAEQIHLQLAAKLTGP
jgi:LPS-assembly lipoprotein